MLQGKTIVSIIPARGGSKGLPGKNIRPLLGHPLIAYSVKASLMCPLIDRTIISTDSEEIATVALQYGAEVPFMRPAELSGDLNTDLEVFQHALQWLQENEGYSPDLLVHLRPTTPVRFLSDIDSCIRKLYAHPEADSLRVVTPSPITPFKMWLITDEETPMKPLLTVEGIEEPFNEPRQRLPQTYWHTGTLDIIRRQTLLNKNSMTGRVILPFVINNEFVADIDDLEAFEKAGSIIIKHNCVKFDS